jgi:hypothetical protein
MAETIRFPFLRARAGIPNESDFVVTLLNAVSTIPKGGEAVYAPITLWRRDDNQTASPFTCIFVEFTANAELVLGDGTNPIGIYGQINLPGGTIQRSLLGILGINYAGTNVPQIPIMQQGGGGPFVGFSQLVSNISVYDALSIGGVLADIALGEGDAVTVRARPIIRRDWLG